MKKLFHSSVINLLVLKFSIPSSTPKPILIDKQVMWNELHGSRKGFYATYRAEIFSTELSTVSDMIRAIDAWRSAGVIFQVEGDKKGNISELHLESSKDCPVKIELLSSPLCNFQQSLPLLVIIISLVVIFTVIATVLIVSMALLLPQLKSRRRKW